MSHVAVIEGEGPVVLGVPHAGTSIPEDLESRLNERGRERTDTDWWVDGVYQDLLPGAGMVKALFHRYVIDANRDPADESLYPGQNTTSLCPTTTFDGDEIYLGGQAPSRDEINQRQQLYHQPYHDASGIDR